MALDINNKILLSQKILPAVDFQITCNGITVTASERLSNPRFLPFDISGRCSTCRGSEAELDFIITKEGITIYCTRFRGKRFVPFDSINDLPGHCFFKIRNRGRVFNVPHGQPPPAQPPKIPIYHHQPAKPHFMNTFVEQKRENSAASPSSPSKKAKQTLSDIQQQQPKDVPKQKEKKKQQQIANLVGNGISGLPEYLQKVKPINEMLPPPPPPPPSQVSNFYEEEENLEPIIKEFYDSMAAATYHLDQKPSYQEQIKNLAEQKKMMDEEIEAIGAIQKTE